MKLAEALIERKDLKARIPALQARFLENAIHDEGEKPEQSAPDIGASLDGALDRMKYLILHINLTNSATVLPNGMTIMEAIVVRDCLKLAHASYTTILSGLKSKSTGRYSTSEVKKVLAEGVTVAEWQKLVDDVAQHYRVLDTQIQAAGWATDLL